MERLMTRFSITFLTVFVLCGVLSAGAQEMMWENITALHFAATGGTDEEHALQQLPMTQLFCSGTSPALP